MSEEDLQAQRAKRKLLYAHYRLAAARISGVIVRPLAAVVEDADRTGAFIEVTVWVTKAEAEKEIG